MIMGTRLWPALTGPIFKRPLVCGASPGWCGGVAPPSSIEDLCKDLFSTKEEVEREPESRLTPGPPQPSWPPPPPCPLFALAEPKLLCDGLSSGQMCDREFYIFIVRDFSALSKTSADEREMRIREKETLLPAQHEKYISHGWFITQKHPPTMWTPAQVLLPVT